MIEDIARTDRGDTPTAVLNEGGPWGGAPDGKDGDGGDTGNPWTRPPRKRPRKVGAPGRPAIDDLIRRGRERFGGLGGGGFTGGSFGGQPIWGYALAAFVLLWLMTTSIHRIDPQERGVVTRFGRFEKTLSPGMNITFPAPVDTVTRVNVDQISAFDVPAAGGENLVLTGDQNIIDLAYSVRWSVRDPELFLFELAEPEDTIKEVAESAMREEIARVSLGDAIGPARAQIEARVAARMQSVLDRYKSGVTVEGVAIKQADPPAAVNDAFKDVSAAQQDAQTYLSQARAYAQQVQANAQGAATSFDKVYDAYKLAPEVTRRRMYYETMEAVLAKTDKVIVDTPGTQPYMPLPLPEARKPVPVAPPAGQ
jgi:membrane protease subunit HflK